MFATRNSESPLKGPMTDDRLREDNYNPSNKGSKQPEENM